MLTKHKPQVSQKLNAYSWDAMLHLYNKLILGTMSERYLSAV